MAVARADRPTIGLRRSAPILAFQNGYFWESIPTATRVGPEGARA